MKKAFAFIMLTIITSCSNSKVSIDKETIKKLSDGDFSIPSVYGSWILFISLDNGEKGSTNVNILHDLFLKNYNKEYRSFESFLSVALNQKMLIDVKAFEKTNGVHFKLNDSITNKYLHSSLTAFINEHFNEKHDKKQVVKSEFVKNKSFRYTIMYYLFINNYQIIFDDYIGEFFVTPMKP